MKEKWVWGRWRGGSTGTAVRPPLGQPPAQPSAPGGPLRGHGRVLLRKVPPGAGVGPARVLLGGRWAAATWCSAAPPAAMWAASAPFCTGAWRALCYGPCNSPAGRRATATGGEQRGGSGKPALSPPPRHSPPAPLRTVPGGFLHTHIRIHLGVLPPFALSQAFRFPSVQKLTPKSFLRIKPVK